MDAIKTARELGKAIQGEACFKAYFSAKEKNDKDEGLQNLIGEFNLQRENMSLEISKPDGEKNQAKIDELNTRMRTTYAEIMSNDNMKEYSRAKNEVDFLINQVNQIIAMSCEGDDPDTCQPVEPSGCGGGCSSCAGCK